MGQELDQAVHRVYQELYQRIHSGELPPNAQLPSYHELARKFEVDGVTVRTACIRLQAEGYLYQKPGRPRWFVKPTSNNTFISRHQFLSGVAAGILANKLTPIFPEITIRDQSKPSAEEKANSSLNDLWDKVLKLKASDMGEVQAQANVKEWLKAHEHLPEVNQLFAATTLTLIQELSRQEAKDDHSHEREKFLVEALRWANETQKAGAIYEPLQHYVQLRQAVLWRQRGGPNSAEHKYADSILTSILGKASDPAIKFGALTERAKLQLEAKQRSEYHTTRQSLQQIETLLTSSRLWIPFRDLLELDAEDVRVRGYARLEPMHAYKHWHDAALAIKKIESRFSQGAQRIPYAVDVSLNFSFARILLASPRSVDHVYGMLQLQQGEARATEDGLFRQARIAQMIREEYIGSAILPANGKGYCDYDRTLTAWEWRKDAGIYVCTMCGRQPLRP